ncbi:MAG: diguanylate cyclase domain-containing protein [Rubrivivax sp.]
MNTPLVPNPGTPPQAAHDLARAQKKVDSARALLVRLLQELVVAEHQAGREQPAVMLEANEQLVLAALRHQDEAEAAALALKTVSRSAGLDPLTQLPNRMLLLDRCTHAMASAKRRGSRLALLFLDLDQFKPINDSLGHALGDEVLKMVAQRLTAAVREADTVSRYGGDEFVILLSEVSQPADAEFIAGKLIAAIAEPCRVDGHVLQLSASIGISLYPDDGDDIELLIRKADNAMYLAKRNGPGRYAREGQTPADEPLRKAPDAAPPIESTRPEPAGAAQERRNAELREANERLVLAALSAQELQAAAERARQRQDELIALVTQELKHPLAPVRLATAMLGRARSDEPLLPRVQSIIEQQARHIARLVDAVHDVARAEAGMLTLEREDVDLIGLIDAATSGCRAAMDARHQHFSARLPGAAVRLIGDRARLQLVVGNLLDNASKYTPDDGAIRLSLEVADDAAVLTVSDNGIGITAQALPQIFEPFAPDTQALGFNGVGRGIGLAVVRALVEAHGGTVRAFSDGSAMGSRFVVTLALPGGAGAAQAVTPAGGA